MMGDRVETKEHCEIIYSCGFFKVVICYETQEIQPMSS